MAQRTAERARKQAGAGQTRLEQPGAPVSLCHSARPEQEGQRLQAPQKLREHQERAHLWPPPPAACALCQDGPHSRDPWVVTVRHTGPAVLQSATTPKPPCPLMGASSWPLHEYGGPEDPEGRPHGSLGQGTRRGAAPQMHHLPEAAAATSDTSGGVRTASTRSPTLGGSTEDRQRGQAPPPSQTRPQVLWGRGAAGASPPDCPTQEPCPARPSGCHAGGATQARRGLRTQGHATAAPGHRASPAERSQLGQGPTPRPWRKGPGRRLGLRCLRMC